MPRVDNQTSGRRKVKVVENHRSRCSLRVLHRATVLFIATVMVLLNTSPISAQDTIDSQIVDQLPDRFELVLSEALPNGGWRKDFVRGDDLVLIMAEPIESPEAAAASTAGTAGGVATTLDRPTITRMEEENNVLVVRGTAEGSTVSVGVYTQGSTVFLVFVVGPQATEDTLASVLNAQLDHTGVTNVPIGEDYLQRALASIGASATSTPVPEAQEVEATEESPPPTNTPATTAAVAAQDSTGDEAFEAGFAAGQILGAIVLALLFFVPFAFFLKRSGDRTHGENNQIEHD